MSQRVANSLRRPYLAASEALRDNPGQWKAYESKGNCVVLAGPGSGKTKTLTIKLARMLAEDVRSPRGVACITYNAECASELKRRLDGLGVHERENVYIGTIHSFCLKNVILPFAHIAGLALPEPFCVASQDDQERAFGYAMGQVIGPNVNPVGWRTGFDKYRRTHVDRLAADWYGEDEQTTELIVAYEAELRRRALIDFDDMVLLGLRLIETNDWVRRSLRARFPILAVDEYQDLGRPLHRIVVSLCFSAGVRLFAVGDEDQSIYGFAGAQPQLLRELAEMNGVETVRLPFNYRSGTTIVEASEAALGEQRGYVAKSAHKGTIDFYECTEGMKEQAESICSQIIPRALERKKGRKLGDIAVLYLNKNDGDLIEGSANVAGMKVIRIDKGAPYRNTLLTRWLKDCAAWCAGGWKSGQIRLSALLRSWLIFNTGSRSDEQRYALRLGLVRFLFAHRNPDMPLHAWLRDMNASCLDDAFKRETSLQDEADAVAVLYRACDRGAKLEELTVGGFGRLQGVGDHLYLITLHSAKGLEFDVVVMMGMDQGRIPAWAIKNPEQKMEPRRLFYVGLTRARDEVHLTYSGFTVDKYGRQHHNGPSEFLIEVHRRLHPK